MWGHVVLPLLTKMAPQQLLALVVLIYISSAVEGGGVCRRVCFKKTKPLCGYSSISGFKTFSGLCAMELQNYCNRADWRVEHSGGCTAVELNNRCKSSNYPVCAYSPQQGYKTFSNKCNFNLQVFKGNFIYRYDGKCAPTPDPVRDCRQTGTVCQGNNIQVCGFSPSRGFQTFDNVCYLTFNNTCLLTDYTVRHTRPCSPTEIGTTCNIICTTIYDPVCGFSFTLGYKTFSNLCEFFRENNCYNLDYTFSSIGACSQFPGNNCSVICNQQYDPVCGFSNTQGFKSFPNQCSLTRENTCFGGDFTISSQGNCPNNPPGGSCDITQCIEPNPQPVCGFSSTLGLNTFPNLCFLTYENNCNGGNYVFQSNGNCGNNTSSSCDPAQCLQANPTQVCANSPTRGQQTFPNDCFLNQENNCNSGDYVKLQDGPCSNTPGSNCDPSQCLQSTSAPVCAFSSTRGSRTFPNQCFLDQDTTCNNGDYVFVGSGSCGNNTNPNPDPCDPRQCIQQGAAEVCAFSPTTGFRTFINDCFLNQDITCNGADYTRRDAGACAPNPGTSCDPTQCLQPNSVQVCGLSPTIGYQTFPNQCFFNQDNNCNGGDYVFVGYGACGFNNGSNCDASRCFRDRSGQVCGFSSSLGYQTFPNRCFLDIENDCNNGDYTNQGSGICPNSGTNIGGDCLGSCVSQGNEPVCGYSHVKGYNTFPTKCSWEREVKCKGEDYLYGHDGECSTDELKNKCVRKCSSEYKPVCASQTKTQSYKTFPNRCELDVAINCDHQDYTFLHHEGCTHKELHGKCNHDCPLYYRAICGYSPEKGHQTFANECFLDRENACTLAGYKLKHFGKCTPKEVGKKCHRSCIKVYTPICGKCPDKGYKTFGNFCLLDKENSCNNENYDVAHQGECYLWEICTNCAD